MRNSVLAPHCHVHILLHLQVAHSLKGCLSTVLLRMTAMEAVLQHKPIITGGLLSQCLARCAQAPQAHVPPPPHTIPVGLLQQQPTQLRLAQQPVRHRGGVVVACRAVQRHTLLRAGGAHPARRRGRAGRHTRGVHCLSSEGQPESQHKLKLLRCGTCTLADCCEGAMRCGQVARPGRWQAWRRPDTHC